MNEEYIKEYEEMSLCDFADELVEPLSTVKQDLTKTIYIHYAKERDENEQLQNNWNELKNIIEQDIRQCEELIEMCPKELRNTIIGTRSYEEIIGCNKHILSKMQEIQGDGNNDSKRDVS